MSERIKLDDIICGCEVEAGEDADFNCADCAEPIASRQISRGQVVHFKDKHWHEWCLFEWFLNQ